MPAQNLLDFLNGITSQELAITSYKPGIIAADLADILPGFVTEALKIGFKQFGNKMKGFLTNNAVLHGIESRTSSPVRIPRTDKLQHPNLNWLYPCGEGAGYAGGIVSAAIDGRKCIEAIAEKYGLK